PPGGPSRRGPCPPWGTARARGRDRPPHPSVPTPSSMPSPPSTCRSGACPWSSSSDPSTSASWWPRPSRRAERCHSAWAVTVEGQLGVGVEDLDQGVGDGQLERVPHL